jgi:hypothetical protein
MPRPSATGGSCTPRRASLDKVGEMRETKKGEDKVGEEWLGAWMQF